MKNRILSFIILAAGMVTSCNTDAEFSEFIPTHALSTLVKSATATCGSETVVGTVDNATHEIQFVFVNNSNFSDVAVTLEYATRAIRKEGAPEEGQKLNLSAPYSFVMNNLEEDFTYTIAASRAQIMQVDHTQCMSCSSTRTPTINGPRRSIPAVASTASTCRRRALTAKWPITTSAG